MRNRHGLCFAAVGDRRQPHLHRAMVRETELLRRSA
jgi:hypothetical protein